MKLVSGFRLGFSDNQLNPNPEVEWAGAVNEISELNMLASCLQQLPRAFEMKWAVNG